MIKFRMYSTNRNTTQGCRAPIKQVLENEKKKKHKHDQKKLFQSDERYSLLFPCHSCGYASKSIKNKQTKYNPQAR